MHLTASNSWAKPWPILKLATIYKSTWVILLTGFGRKVIFEKNVSRCISPPPLNTSLYSTTLQPLHSWHSKGCPWTFLFCTDTAPGLQTCPTGGLSIRTFFSPKKAPKCPVLHSHKDRSWCLTDLLGHCSSHSASEMSRAREKIQRNRSPTAAPKPG